MQEGAEALKRVCVETGVDGMGTGGARLEGLEAALIEVMDGVADGLVIAAQSASNGGRGLSFGAGEKHLAAAQGKGGGRAQSSFESCAFLRREWSNKQRCLHTHKYTG